MNQHLKKISEEVVHANPWWQYKHDTFEKLSGESGDYYYGETRGNVMVVPILPDGRLILISQFRYLFERLSVEFPCGGIKDNTVAEEMAKIELAEEIGWQAEELVKVGEFQPLNGMVKDKCHVFLAYVGEQGKQQLEDTEEIEVLYRRPDEVDEMIRKNEIWDGQTMAAWALAHHHFLHKEL